MTTATLDAKPRIGVSSCLLGNRVRWDGTGRRDDFLVDVLGAFVEYLPVCPEVEAGFGVPREPVRLVGDPREPRMIGLRSGVDYTDRMRAWAAKRAEELAGEGLCGFVFKSGSPSSGMMRVKVYGEGTIRRGGVGMFARALTARLPLLPVADEGRLNDLGLRENFIERIFVAHRWQRVTRTRGGLVAFHTAHKLLIMAHSVEHYRLLGRLVASAAPLAELFAEYERQLAAALGLQATVRKNTNVLSHVMGYFRKDLTAGEKRELLEIIESYRRELVPLIVPVTLLNHYVRKYGQEYLAGQLYLHPHPLELKLRNHA
ncbi:MAG: DUF523 and DUF1722 domain-containing protein [Thermodesulfobacteriota bacterium]